MNAICFVTLVLAVTMIISPSSAMININQLKNTFTEVTFGQGEGDEHNFNLTPSSSIIPFQNYTSGNICDRTSCSIYDPGNLWDAGKSYYTVPYSGIYILTGKLRLDDNSNPSVSYGVGIGNTTADIPSAMVWGSPSQTDAGRNGIVNTRTSHFNAGDHLMMWTYADDETWASDGYFSVLLVYPDDTLDSTVFLPAPYFVSDSEADSGG